jgi:hypothetical protein
MTVPLGPFLLYIISKQFDLVFTLFLALKCFLKVDCIMANSPAEMIKNFASARGIKLTHTSVECLFFIYASVFRESQETLEGKVEFIAKDSIERMREALEEIHITFAHLKEQGKLIGKNYSDAEQIRPIIEDALACLIGVLQVHDMTKTVKPERPEDLRMRLAALNICSTNLLACRSHISEINKLIGWRCEEEQAQECLQHKSTSPSSPTDIKKARAKRQKPA